MTLEQYKTKSLNELANKLAETFKVNQQRKQIIKTGRLFRKP